jgi:hypothetical protein
MIQRALCAIGWHRWEMDRYWSIGGLLVEGRVCRDCKQTQRERKVVYRP